MKRKWLRTCHKRKKHRALWFGLRASVFCVLCAIISVSFLKGRGLSFKNVLRKSEYPCRGAYLTEECGEINWQLFSREPIDFVYVRAGKGSASGDKRYLYNTANAAKYNIPTGLVHDFDYGKSGLSQAETFSEKLCVGMLIPALDIRKNLFEKILYDNDTETAAEINAFATCIKEKFGCGIILLCDKDIYKDLNVETSGAYVWAEDYSPNNYCGSWMLLSYNEYGSSKALRSPKKKYTLLSAAKGITIDEFILRYTVKIIRT